MNFHQFKMQKDGERVKELIDKISLTDDIESLCKELVQEKIKINFREHTSDIPKQNVAISYSQARKLAPKCRKFL